MDKKLIPCRTYRISSDGKKFLSAKEMEIVSLECKIGGAILARYWKGIEGNNSNAIIEVTESNSD